MTDTLDALFPAHLLRLLGLVGPLGQGAPDVVIGALLVQPPLAFPPPVQPQQPLSQA